jgi:hypothetical protein
MTINNPNTTTKKFKFTNANLKSLPSNSANSSSTELEVSDIEIISLKCLSGKTGNKRFLLLDSAVFRGLTTDFKYNYAASA